MADEIVRDNADPAREAERLLNDSALMEAFEAVRFGALRDLAEVDVENKSEILRLQAIANCLQDVRELLHMTIVAQGSKDGGFSVEKPTAH